MNTLPLTPALPFPLAIEPNQLLVFITEGRQRRGLTELIARLALMGPFHVIAGGGWVPDQDDLHTAIRQYTTNVDSVWKNFSLTRPDTHLQFLDLVTESSKRHEPLLILDFLNLFYDQDTDVSQRKRVVEQCCEQLRQIKQTRPIVILIREIPAEDYELFYPMVVSIADDTVQLERDALLEALLPEAGVGKNLKSARGLAEKLRAKLNFIGTMIDSEDRAVTRQFGEWIMDHSVEIHRSTQLAAMEAALTMIAVEEHKRITRLADDLHTFMEEMDRRLDRLDEFIKVNE
jgi:hypothetical protein